MSDPSVDVCLEALAEHRRRRILSYLRNSPPGTATVGELADHLARPPAGPGNTFEVSPATVRKRLVHVDLPKLEAAGLVSWHRETDEIAYVRTELVERILTVLEEHGESPLGLRSPGLE